MALFIIKELIVLLEVKCGKINLSERFDLFGSKGCRMCLESLMIFVNSLLDRFSHLTFIFGKQFTSQV